MVLTIFRGQSGPLANFRIADQLDTNAMPLRSTEEFQFRVTEQDHFS